MCCALPEKLCLEDLKVHCSGVRGKGHLLLFVWCFGFGFVGLWFVVLLFVVFFFNRAF